MPNKTNKKKPSKKQHTKNSSYPNPAPSRSKKKDFANSIFGAEISSMNAIAFGHRKR